MPKGQEEEDDEFPFGTIDPNTPVCKNINPDFCKAVFQLKQMIYKDIIYSKDPMTPEAQDIGLINVYDDAVRKLNIFFMNVFKGIQTPIPTINGIAPETQEALNSLYNRSVHERQNNDRYSLDFYKMFLENMFHFHKYDMGTSE